MVKAIIIGVIAIVILVLIIILYGQIHNLKNLKQKLKEAETKIEQFQKYEQGKKEDDEKISEMDSGNKLSNFNDSINLLRK